MAELILTDKEKSDPLYTDWDDAALGKAVKVAASTIRDTKGKGMQSVLITSVALVLVGIVHENNAEALSLILEGHQSNGEITGDWEIYVMRKDMQGGKS